jgi:hypothetical protein
MGAAVPSTGYSAPEKARSVTPGPSGDRTAPGQRGRHRIGDGLPAFVDRAEDLSERAPHRLETHPGELLGHRVHERHHAVHVGGDHGVADGRQRGSQPLPLLALGLLGAEPLALHVAERQRVPVDHRGRHHHRAHHHEGGPEESLVLPGAEPDHEEEPAQPDGHHEDGPDEPPCHESRQAWAGEDAHEP